MKHPANWFNSLLHALDGFILACTERNFRFHLAAAVVVCIGGWTLHLSLTEWCFILSAITLVLITELINTAIESFCDLITMNYSIHIKRIKDLSAAAVLVSSIYALSIAAFILLPKLILYF